MKANIILNLINKSQTQIWYIGFINKEYINLPKAERFKRVSWLKLNGYNEGWFADPFFLKIEDNHIQLLVEEFVYEQNKGVISLLDIDYYHDSFQLGKVSRLLELPTHLSFPNIWREKDKIYVYPENWQSGALYIYELDTNIKKLINPVKIVDVPLVDSSIFVYENKYYVIGTRRKNVCDSEMEDMKSADIFCSNLLFGPYEYKQTIINERSVERGAGEIFREGESLIRPVQKCDNYYGEAVIFNKLSCENGNFCETGFSIIEPVYNMKYGKSLHTFNSMNNLCVIDGREYCHPLSAKLVQRFLRMRNLFN